MKSIRSSYNIKENKERRKILRNNSTRYEQMLWKYLKSKQLGGYKFRRQFGIGKYIVDFYCPKVKLAIELDGGSHFCDNDATKYDADRQKYIEALGIKVLRFINTDLDLYPEEVLQPISKNLP